MLTLSRNVGESVILNTSDGPIKVVFVKSNGPNQIHLGFHAPRKVEIAREELIINGDEWRRGKHGQS